MTTTNDAQQFHRYVATELISRYRNVTDAPEGWREYATWHSEQAQEYRSATELALEVTEAHIAQMDFRSAQRWVSRTLSLIERVEPNERATYELRAYALALAVLEFGGQYREALEYARRMLRVARAVGNRAAEIRALLASGRMQRELGQLNSAETTLRDARQAAAVADLNDLEADVRFHLAKVYQLQGRHMEALQELRQAESEPAIQDDRARLAVLLTGIGDIHRMLDATREALGFYARALRAEQERGSLRGQGVLHEKIALTLLAQGQLEDARDVAQESLRMRQLIGDTVGQARAFSVLGTIQGRLGAHEQALEHHEQARTLDEQTQNVRGQGVALMHLGDEARAMGRADAAQRHYERALELARQAHDQLAATRALERVGDLYADAGRRELANNAWAEALRAREMLGHSEEAAALRERIRTGHVPHDGEDAA